MIKLLRSVKGKTHLLFTLQISVLELIFFSGSMQNLPGIWQHYNDYSVSIEEIHHTKKLDAPSGTAISLAQGIIRNTFRI